MSPFQNSDVGSGASLCNTLDQGIIDQLIDSQWYNVSISYKLLRLLQTSKKSAVLCINIFYYIPP